MAMTRGMAERVYDRARADGYRASLSQRGQRYIVHVRTETCGDIGEEIASLREYHAWRNAQ